jgi:hypothetical protein
MPDIADKLNDWKNRLLEFAAESDALLETGILRQVSKRCEEVGRTSSNSWLGYQANVYYKDFQEPPAGVFFDAEFGLDGSPFAGPDPNWVEVVSKDVEDRVFGPSGEAALAKVREFSAKGRVLVESAKAEVLPILRAYLADRDDSLVARIAEEIRAARILGAMDIANQRSPKKHVITQDERALMQGTWAPPHVNIESRIGAATEPSTRARELAGQLAKVTAHLGRAVKPGASPRAQAPVFFVITAAHDEKARANVIQQVALLQKRVITAKPVLLIEEGSGQVPNLDGVGLIRFPKGDIATAFEEVRRALEKA